MTLKYNHDSNYLTTTNSISCCIFSYVISRYVLGLVETRKYEYSYFKTA